MSAQGIPTQRTVHLEARGPHGPIWCTYTGLMTEQDEIDNAQALADSTGHTVRLFLNQWTWTLIDPAARGVAS